MKSSLRLFYGYLEADETSFEHKTHLLTLKSQYDKSVIKKLLIYAY